MLLKFTACDLFRASHLHMIADQIIAVYMYVYVFLCI